MAGTASTGVQQGLMLLLQQILCLGVLQVKVLCAELCTSSFLLSGKELAVFQGEEASNLFAHDGSENSITTLPWRLNLGGSVSTFLTASRHFGLCQQPFASKKTLLKVQQDQNVQVKCWEGRGSKDISLCCHLTELRGVECVFPEC